MLFMNKSEIRKRLKTDIALLDKDKEKIANLMNNLNDIKGMII